MKRYVATGLWFYSFWYLGSMISSLVGIPDLLGPVLGTSAGAIVLLDPRRLFWGHRTESAAAAPAAA